MARDLYWNAGPAVEEHPLLAKDPNLIKPKEYTELSQRATELKRTLTARFQKLTADR